MSLSPNDIRNFAFPTQMRGYDKDEVNNFKEQVAGALEAAKQENLKLSMELESVKTQLAGLKQFEDTIKGAAIDARRNADMTVANAKKEAELILSKARAELERDLASRSAMVSQIEDQITKLGMTKKSYLAKVRSLIQSHLDMIDEVDGTEGHEHRKRKTREDDIEVESSSEVNAKVRETVATPPARHSGIKTEDANDPSTELSDSAKTALAKAISNAARPEEARPEPDPFNTPGIDPELAAALKSYKTSKAAEHQAESAHRQATPPPVVETTSRAEDIPDGFVANDPPARASKVGELDDADESVEHNQIDPDAEERKPRAKAAPGNIANELDEVVAKFEAEMDKAART
jgi:cell division initiation protein